MSRQIVGMQAHLEIRPRLLVTPVSVVDHPPLDEDLIGLVERAAYSDIYLDAVFMPGTDARYGKALQQLVNIGNGQMKPLTREQHWLGLGKDGKTGMEEGE